MNEIISSFVGKCTANGISVYKGSVFEKEHVFVLLDEPEDLITFCVQNGIHSLILHESYSEAESIDKDDIIEKITRFFENKKAGYPYSPLPHNIQKDYYDIVLSKVIENINRDPIFMEQAKFDQMEAVLEAVDFFAIHPNCVVSTTIELDSDAETAAFESGEMVSEEEVLNRFAHQIIVGLQDRCDEAKKESERLKKAAEDEVLQQIAEEVKENDSLLQLKTQTSRNDYANRLYAVWCREKGHDWLTKGKVREIVDLEYVYVTGGKA